MNELEERKAFEDRFSGRNLIRRGGNYLDETTDILWYGWISRSFCAKITTKTENKIPK